MSDVNQKEYDDVVKMLDQSEKDLAKEIRKNAALLADNAALREALKPFADSAIFYSTDDPSNFIEGRLFGDITVADLRRAAALRSDKRPK